MSTKNLARTIIEGGRAPFNKAERAGSHAAERALTRAHLARSVKHEDGFDAYAIGIRPKVHKGFADKLAPAGRWLRSHVGRPWNKVRSEIFERFDPRTLAGQHIVVDHLLRDVDTGDNFSRFQHPRLIVDAHGILRELPFTRKPVRPDRTKLRASEQQMEQWSCGRRVGGHGGTLYFYVLTRRCTECSGADCCCPHVDGERRHGAHEHYRQDQRLNAGETSFWNGLCEDVQDRHRFRRP